MSLESTKADDIAVLIEEAIVSGELAPGTVLRQEQVSERFGVSRTPVREALRKLAALGLVSFEPNRGVRDTPNRSESCSWRSTEPGASSPDTIADAVATRLSE